MTALAGLNMSAEQLLAQTDLLTFVLLYHISTEVYPTTDAMVDAKTVTTLSNQTLTFSSSL